MPTFVIPYVEDSTRRALHRVRSWRRERGIRLILADPADADGLPGAFDGYLEVPTFTEVGRAFATLERYARAHGLDGLVVQSEYALLPGTLLNAARGLRGISLRAALRCTNKYLTRRVLAAAGVPQPRFELVSDCHQALRFAEDVGFPVVLKPVASTMGRLVVRADSRASLRARARQLLRALRHAPDVARCREFARLAGLDMECDPVAEFLIEEYVEGRPVETDGLIFGNRIETFGVTEQVLSPPPRFHVEGYLFPSSLDPAPVVASSDAALRALGLKDAGFSVELRVSDAGVRVIEVNGRLGEDDGFPELFRSVRGRYPIQEWIEYLASEPSGGNGRHMAVPRRRRPRAALAYRSWYRAGIVRKVRRAPGVQFAVPPGTRLKAPPRNELTPHVAYALATHPTDVWAAYVQARERVGQARFVIE